MAAPEAMAALEVRAATVAQEDQEDLAEVEAVLAVEVVVAPAVLAAEAVVAPAVLAAEAAVAPAVPAAEAAVAPAVPAAEAVVAPAVPAAEAVVAPAVPAAEVVVAPAVPAAEAVVVSVPTADTNYLAPSFHPCFHGTGNTRRDRPPQVPRGRTRPLNSWLH